MLNVFTGDAFNVVALTRAINKAPFKPGRIGEIGLFEEQGVRSVTVVVEELSGVLSILGHKPRGGPANQHRRGQRKARSFTCYHMPLEDTIHADDIQGVRLFGSEDETETADNAVNDVLESMRQQHEVTREWLRAGAIAGVVVDGESAKTVNLFAEFGQAETDVDFLIGTTTTDMRQKCLEVKDAVETALGALPYDHVHALCGQNFFRRFIAHPEVKYAYQQFQEGRFLRDDPRSGFEFGSIIFEEYRGNVGSKPFIPAGNARFFPVGAPDLFIEHFGPADFMETANTIGLPYYAKQAPMEFDRGVKVHSQSNPLPICTIPACLVKGSSSN